MLVSEIITKVQGKFEGGGSFTVNWYELVKEGVDALRTHINPKTLLKTASLTEISDNTEFTAPSDYYAHSMLYASDNIRGFSYRKPAIYLKELEIGTYTIVLIDGVKKVLVSHTYSTTETFTLEYFSKLPFIDKDGTTWKAGPENDDDSVNLEEDEIMIAVYETALATVQEGVVGTERSNEEKRFEKQLSRRYEQYNTDNGSTKQTESHELGAEIELGY